MSSSTNILKPFLPHRVGIRLDNAWNRRAFLRVLGALPAQLVGGAGAPPLCIRACVSRQPHNGKPIRPCVHVGRDPDFLMNLPDTTG